MLPGNKYAEKQANLKAWPPCTGKRETTLTTSTVVRSYHTYRLRDNFLWNFRMILLDLSSPPQSALSPRFSLVAVLLYPFPPNFPVVSPGSSFWNFPTGSRSWVFIYKKKRKIICHEQYVLWVSSQVTILTMTLSVFDLDISRFRFNLSLWWSKWEDLSGRHTLSPLYCSVGVFIHTHTRAEAVSSWLSFLLL